MKFSPVKGKTVGTSTTEVFLAQLKQKLLLLMRFFGPISPQTAGRTEIFGPIKPKTVATTDVLSLVKEKIAGTTEVFMAQSKKNCCC